METNLLNIVNRAYTEKMTYIYRSKSYKFRGEDLLALSNDKDVFVELMLTLRKLNVPWRKPRYAIQQPN